MSRIFPPSMPALLDRLDRWLRRNRPAYYSRLRPGASERDLMKFERNLGRNLPAGLRALYRWHDGQEAGCSSAFQYQQMFMPLADVRRASVALNQLYFDGEFSEMNWWSTAWLPFLDNGSGDHLCVDLDGAFAGHPGQVVSFYHDWDRRNIEYPSLEKWLQVFVTGTEADMWEENDGAFQPLDADQMRGVRSRLTPGYPRERVAGGTLVMRGW
jgi:cell wall assembly regulator SMI1